MLDVFSLKEYRVTIAEVREKPITHYPSHVRHDMLMKAASDAGLTEQQVRVLLCADIEG